MSAGCGDAVGPLAPSTLKSLLVVADKDGEREYSEEYQFYVRRVRR